MDRQIDPIVLQAARFTAEALERRLLLTSSVSTAVTNFGGAQQELDYTLTAGVNQYQFTGAFALVDLLQNQVVNDMDLWVDDTSATAPVVTWPYYSSAGNPDGVLHDGHYEGVLENGAVFSAAHVLSFSVYRGDADGDHDVDFQDLAVYAQHVNTAGTYSQGDFNYDGTVDFNDLAILAQKYGTSLAAIPANPNELTSGSATASSISLNFTAPIDPSTGVASTLFTGFRVYRSSNGLDFMQVSSDSDTSLLRDGSPVYTWTNTGRVDGTKYYYRVRPYNTDTTNGAPTGDWHTTNKVWSVTVLPAPDTLTATRTSASNVDLSWADHSVTETTYEIQRARNSTFTSGVTTFTTSAGSGTRTWTDTTATGAGSYFYRVRGTNSVQQSAWTVSIVSVTPAAATLNHAPVITGTTPLSMQVSPLDGFPSTLTLPATIRDFQPSGVAGYNDFQQPATGLMPGLVEDTLGVDGTPVLSSSHIDGDGAIADATSFYNWYHDTSENQKTTIALTFTLDRMESGVPIYRFAPTGEFLPINGRLWGNQNRDNTVNGNFTLEAHTQFTYHAGAVAAPSFSYLGDDDIWVFINHKLVSSLDLGGIHASEPGAVTLDSATATGLGISDGGTYDFDIFYAERQIGTSAFAAETSIPIFGNYDYKAHLTATDADAGDTLTWVVMEPQGATITPREGTSPLESDLVYVPTSDDLGTTKHFKVAVSDGHDGFDMKEWDVGFTASANHAPEPLGTLTPPLTATVGVSYSWDASAFFTDVDDDELQFLALGGLPLPDGMNLSASGIFSWLPSAGDRGAHPIAFEVVDGHGGSLYQEFAVTVLAQPLTISLTAGTSLDFPATPRDVDREANLVSGESFAIPGELGGAGALADVTYILPSDNDSIVIGRDIVFDQDVNGDLLVHCFSPVIFFLKTTYIDQYSASTTEYVGITNDLSSADPPEGKMQTQEVRRFRPQQQYDLVLVSTGPDPDNNVYLQTARKIWPNAFPMNNVEQTVQYMQAVALMSAVFGDPDPFDVLLVDHGKNGFAGMGSGGDFENATNKYVSFEGANTNNNFMSSTMSFYSGLMDTYGESELINSITFAECEVTKSFDPGRHFLKKLAMTTGVTHAGYSRKVWVETAGTGAELYFYTYAACRLWTAAGNTGDLTESPLP